MVPFLLWGGRKVDLEFIFWMSFSPTSSSPSSSSLSMRRHLSRRRHTSIVAPTPVSSRLSRTAAGCHFPLVVVVVVVVTIMTAIVIVIVAPSLSSSSPVAIVVVIASRCATAHRAVAIAIVVVVAICWKKGERAPSLAPNVRPNLIGLNAACLLIDRCRLA